MTPPLPLARLRSIATFTAPEVVEKCIRPEDPITAIEVKLTDGDGDGDVQASIHFVRDDTRFVVDMTLGVVRQAEAQAAGRHEIGTEYELRRER